MFTRRLMTTVLFAVLHTITSGLNEDSQSPKDQIDTDVGKRVRMECELSNSTTSTINGLWLRIEDAEVFFYSMTRIKQDIRFQIEQRPTLHIVNSTTSYEVVTYSLTIEDVHLSDDGTYSCQADNRIIKQFILNIVERPHFVTHEYTTSLRTQIGKNVTIDCEAQGKPSPLVSWTKRMPDDNNQKAMINCSTTPTICQLHIVNVNRWSGGTFECVATNAFGTIGRFYELDVQFPPDVHSSMMKSFHYADDSVTLGCLIDTNPEADVRWFHRQNNETSREIDLTSKYREGHTIHHHRRRTNELIWSIEQEQINATRWKTTLFIERLPKRFLNSIFICRATNRFGQNQHEIFIIENHHYHVVHSSKKYRHTTPTSISLITSSINNENHHRLSPRRKQTSTENSERLAQANSQSMRRFPNLFYSLIIVFYLMSSSYVQ